jgi:Bacterial pullanase-associated domain
MKRRELCGCIAAAAALLAASALPVQAAGLQLAAVPDDSIALHYYRPDGNYEGWGVHFWESFEKVKDGKIVGGKDKSDMPIMEITWGSPMKPTGTDGFGLYWVVKANEFRNTKINYIIHRGDSKDCTKDSAWFLPQGRQVFINAGDCTAYFSADDAIKARK